jgi:hypothetical protein
MSGPKYRFTAYDLDSCVDMARVLHANGSVLTTDQLAHHLEYKSANNGAFNTRLANARLFGLVEGSAELRPTTRALRILFPDYPAEASAARLEAFEAVPLYAAVLSTYHGQPLPDEQGLKNALNTRFGVAPDKVAMVYSRLMECAEQAGLFQLAGARTKMLRPALGSSRPTDSHVSAVAPTTAPGPSPAEAAPSRRVEGVAGNGLIQAALAELPPQEGATEEELRQWLSFFESALRVVYRLPRSGAST